MMETKDVSVLQDLGAGLTGILSPVSICMGLTVVLVRLLNPDGKSGSAALRFASIAYSEDPTDSESTKFEGAFLNALIYVGIVTVMTFAIVLLFKFGCQRIVWAWMAIGVFDIFFAITGLIGIEVLQALGIHMDVYSFFFMLFNFAVVGVIGVLFVPIPLLLKQCYLVWVGVISAYIFTWIPEWTAWMIICAMALYDIAAVLLPGGPLKLLLDEAMKREEALPGLLYEARPTRGPYQGPDVWTRRTVSSARPRGEADGEGEGGGGCVLASSSTQAILVADGALPERSPEQALHGLRQEGQPPGQALHQQHPQLQQAPAFGPGQQHPQLTRHQHLDLVGSCSPAPSVPKAASPPSPSASTGATTAEALGNGASTLTGPPLARELHGQGEPSVRGVGGVEMAGKGGVHLFVGQGAAALMPGLVGSAALASAKPVQQQQQQQQQQQEREQQQEVLPFHHGGRLLQQPLDQQDESQQQQEQEVHPGNHDQHLPQQFLGQQDEPQQQQQQLLRPPSMIQGTSPAASDEELQDVEEGQRLLPAQQGQHNFGPGVVASGEARGLSPEEAGEEEGGLIDDLDAIKLGLGDFVFYSLLVGRAAMYDCMTVFAAYIGIIAGLGLTLIFLAISQHALPALPFSIAMGVMFYFFTRLVLEPFMVPMAMQLQFY
ncbi:Presenilin-domain-containing protein [Dunaliella salina]|uniref:Presenilin n=1 Tax=Dunaliella salina TaxID=3046 RepID=A0ABQ7GB78_DUNSA|nr:Presenilin-domain-containing protein [Dunaliella salina]|eukprot:KAF5831859.1 Presenilin-domain-containing protein [Dunaliella salina]